jgi:predicted nucleic acid-binding Zn ribbon protein
MRRLGDLLPHMATALGLEDELRTARAMASWRRIVAEHVPAASGATELVAVQPATLVVSASAPIVAQELRMRSTELLDAFATAPGGSRTADLRIVVRAAGDGSGHAPFRGPASGRPRSGL